MEKKNLLITNDILFYNKTTWVFTDYMWTTGIYQLLGIQNKLPQADTSTKLATETYVNELSVISLFQIIEYGRVIKIG